MWTTINQRKFWNYEYFQFETDMRVKNPKVASKWLSPLVERDIPLYIASISQQPAARFTVERYGRPWFVSFDKPNAVRIVNAIISRGDESCYYEGLERPSKRSYEHGSRVVLPPVRKSPDGQHSASSTHVHYWGEGGKPDRPEKYLVERYSGGTWMQISAWNKKYLALSAKRRGDRIRVIGGDSIGYATLEIIL